MEEFKEGFREQENKLMDMIEEIRKEFKNQRNE